MRAELSPVALVLLLVPFVAAETAPDGARLTRRASFREGDNLEIYDKKNRLMAHRKVFLTRRLTEQEEKMAFDALQQHEQSKAGRLPTSRNQKGSVYHVFQKSTMGVIGKEGLAVTHSGKADTPFFELPVDALEPVDERTEMR